MTLAERAQYTAELAAGRSRRPVPTPAPATTSAPALAPAPGEPPGITRPVAAGPPVSRRHCWVLGPPDAPGRWPGLLVEWARTGDVWRGRVVYVVDDEGQAVLVESWVPSRQLEPR
ncbi:hypothetical protein [Angustibacter aerolatus]